METRQVLNNLSVYLYMGETGGISRKLFMDM